MGRKQRLKKQQNRENKTDKGQQRGTLYWVVFACLCVLMFYPPYFRGLFFDRELLPTHMFTAVLFGLWWIYKLSVKRDPVFLRTPLDYAALGMAAVYFISIFAAVNVRLAIGEFLKYVNYFMAYWLAGELARSRKEVKVFLNVLLASAVGVALLGIGAAAGTFSYNGAFVGGRINSSIQYPNTLAAYLTAAYFISMTLLLNGDKKCQKYLYSTANFILFFTFIFTYSRGAWLLFPIVFLIYLIGLAKENRVRAVENFIIVLIPSLLCLQGFASSIGGSREIRAWLWFFAGIGLTGVCLFISGYVAGINRKVKLAFVGLISITLIAAAIAAFTAVKPIALHHTAEEEAGWKSVTREVKNIRPDTEYVLKVDIESENPDDQPYSWRIVVNSFDEDSKAVQIFHTTGGSTEGTEAKEFSFKTRPDTKTIMIYFQNYYPNTSVKFDNIELTPAVQGAEPVKVRTVYRYIPENLVNRIFSISLEETSASARFAFYRDAFRIIKDYPIIGTGGGGWASIYFGYQSHLYWSNQVHNYFMQVWVETGTLGLLTVLALWILVIFTVIKLYKSETAPEEKQLIWGIFIPAAALGIHSIIDFNLSLGAVALYLWFLFGIINGRASAQTAAEGRKRDMYSSLTSHYAWSLAVSALIFAVSLALFAGYNWGQKGIALLTAGEVQAAEEAFKKASKYDPLTASFRADRGQILGVMGNNLESEELLEEAEKEMQKAVSLDKYNPRLNAHLGAFYLRRGNIEEGLKYLEKASQLHPYNVNYYEYLSDAYVSIAKELIRRGSRDESVEFLDRTLDLVNTIKDLNLQSVKKMDTTPKLILNIEKAAYIKDNIENRRIYREVDDIVFAASLMIDTRGEGLPDLWRKADTAEGCIQTEIISREKDSYIRIENPGSGLGYIYSRDFELQPKSDYVLVMKARGSVQPGRFRVYIASRTGQRTQASAASVNLTEDWQEIKIAFRTTADIEPGKQYIRLDHTGKDEGYIEIKEIFLLED
jgi:tetratricopeptide (TPR) repeat protein